MKLGPLTLVAAVHVGVYCVLLSLMIGTSNHVQACTLDGCDHPDCGSCGNACCSLLITVNESTEAVMHKLNQSITEEGGPDQLYLPMLTASGTMTFSDLRQYGAGADFLGQALHTTLNGKYNDTINFSLSPTTIKKNNKNMKKKKGTIISAFSISDIAGAYCDSGQNYWNILQLIEGIQWENDDTPLIEHVGESCPTTTTNANLNTKTPPVRVHKHKKEQEEDTNNDDGSSIEDEEPEDTSFSSEEEEDTDSVFSSSEDETISETTTTTDEEDVDENGSNENTFNALSKNMDTTTTTTDDPLLRPLSMGKHFLIVVVGMVFLVSGSYAVVLMRKKKQQAQRTSAVHSTSSFREKYGQL
mmetsp:Transcript_47892/g.54259  ORF Transcript_47892/g.54259 Transcript_47892/m.54259 type:complete len:358 (+) Transcript_47892:112-1185(+)